MVDGFHLYLSDTADSGLVRCTLTSAEAMGLSALCSSIHSTWNKDVYIMYQTLKQSSACFIY